MEERLQKFMARAGVGSRRKCEELIAEGRVTVNGKVAGLGSKVDPDRDTVEVDGRPIAVPSAHEYIILNKPAGYVTTASDPQGRPTVFDLVPNLPTRVYPVGRLDMDTEGVLLLTSDGDAALVLTHPRYGITKTYVAVVKGRPSPTALARLTEGVMLEDGRAKAASARLLQDGDRSVPKGITPAPGEAVVELVLNEGRKREVKRMLAEIGHPVVRLVRTKFGPFTARGLRSGAWRRLTPAEREMLLGLVEAKIREHGRARVRTTSRV